MKKARLITEYQARALQLLCQQAKRGDTGITNEDLDCMIEVLKDKNHWDLSSASRHIERLLEVHNNAPHSQKYSDFTIDQLIYIIARLSISLHKEPRPGDDGKWSTHVAYIKDWLGAYLQMGHNLLK